MRLTAMRIPGAAVLHSESHEDRRGSFRECFRADQLAELTGIHFNTAQVNLSISRAGTLRGIHFAQTPPGQAKYVTSAHGTLIDFVVDLRVGSPTFGKYDHVTLRANEPTAVLIDAGIGHAFYAVDDDTTAVYLCSTVYQPSHEHTINPLDADIGLSIPAGRPLTLSHRDRDAPQLSELIMSGVLPEWSGTFHHFSNHRAGAT